MFIYCISLYKKISNSLWNGLILYGCNVAGIYITFDDIENL